MKFKNFIFCLIIFTAFIFPAFSSDDILVYVGEKIDMNTYIDESIDFTSPGNITWSSGNSQIATINSSGILTGVSPGSVIIIATSGEGIHSQSKLINVNISSMIESFEIVDSKINIYQGEKYQINYNIVSKSDASSTSTTSIKWYSENTRVASVDDNGFITGMGIGETIITGTTLDGNKSDRVTVSIRNLRDKIFINNNAYNVRLKVGESLKLKATIGIDDVSENVFWSSSRPKFLSIDQSGNIKALKEGKISVKATTGNKLIYDYIDVYVTSMVKALKFNITSKTLKEIGETFKLETTLIPVDSDVPPIIDTISWSSTNDEIASVDTLGNVTAHKDGIVRISAVSDDGEKQAGCTVRVDTGAVPKRVILVESIEFEALPEYCVYGEKIPLDYRIYPENATDKEVKITVSSGSDNQIKLIDGNYYFVPDKTGETKLTIKASTNVTDEAKIRVDSAITKLEIKPRDLIYENKKYTMYIGQKVLLDYSFNIKNPYSDYNVYPEHFIVTSNANTTASLEKLDDQIVIRGINTGSAIIEAHTKDNKYSDEITVLVKSPIKNSYTDRKVIVPINKIYKPGYYGELNKSNQYKFDKLDLTNSYEITIIDKYIKESYIDQEIAFENEFISKLKFNENTVEIENRKERLKVLKLMKGNAKEGYCKFLSNTNLKDRNGENLRVAEIIDGNKIIGLIDGKADIRLNMIYSKIYTKSTIEFTSDKSLFEITTDSNKKEHYDTILKSLNYMDLVNDSSIEEKIDFALLCKSRFYGKLEEDIPSPEYAKSVLKLESKDLLTDQTKINYRKNLNREELSELSLKIYDYLSKKKLKENDSFRFLDTKNPDIITAYELGFIKSKDADYFHPGSPATKDDVNYALTAIKNKLDSEVSLYNTKINVLEFKELLNTLASSDKITIEEMIGLMGRIIK